MWRRFCIATIGKVADTKIFNGISYLLRVELMFTPMNLKAFSLKPKYFSIFLLNISVNRWTTAIGLFQLFRLNFNLFYLGSWSTVNIICLFYECGLKIEVISDKRLDRNLWTFIFNSKFSQNSQCSVKILCCSTTLNIQ